MLTKDELTRLSPADQVAATNAVLTNDMEVLMALEKALRDGPRGVVFIIDSIPVEA